MAGVVHRASLKPAPGQHLMRDFLAFLFFRCVCWEDLPDRLVAWCIFGVVGYSVFKTLEGSI